MNGAWSNGVTVGSSAVNEAINALSAALLKSSSETVPDISLDIPCKTYDIFRMYVCMYVCIVCMYVYNRIFMYASANTNHPEVSPDNDLSVHL